MNISMQLSAPGIRKLQLETMLDAACQTRAILRPGDPTAHQLCVSHKSAFSQHGLGFWICGCQRGFGSSKCKIIKGLGLRSAGQPAQST